MYFIPRFNKLFSLVADMRNAYRYLLLALFLVGLVGVWLFASYYTIESYIQGYHSKINEIQQQIVQCHESDTMCKVLNQSIIGLSNELKNLQQGAIVDRFQMLTSTIFSVLYRTGIVFNSYGSERDTDKGWYQLGMVRFDVVAPYQKFLQFVYELCASHALISIDSVQATSNEKADFNFNVMFSLIALKNPSTFEKS
ncbi:MAG TPA: hypothetical protein VGT41_04350 [Candidatus Babeliales bacterium]|nr:hypothetical protein [Candidatus Babeliales bacterium]